MSEFSKDKSRPPAAFGGLPWLFRGFRKVTIETIDMAASAPSSRRQMQVRFQVSKLVQFDLELHLIISRLDMFRRLRHHRVVVERRVHMRQDGSLRLQPSDPVERLLQRQMARMVAVLQRIDDQHVEIVKLARQFPAESH